MRGSLPGEKALMWGPCWVSICTTPAINHNFKDQHKSTTNHLPRAYKNTYSPACRTNQTAEGPCLMQHTHEGCLQTHAYAPSFICDNKPPCSQQNENTFLPRGGPHLSLQTHTEPEPNVWCSAIVWQLSLQLPWWRGAAALALKA